MSFWLTETQHPNGPVFVVTHGQHDASSKQISEGDVLSLWKQARVGRVIFTTAAADWVKFKLHATEDGLC
jgi:hypothetical protein